MSDPVDAVANEFLRGRFGEITPMKLQKLVYYAHAWSLAIFDEPLIEDRIEAWVHGPVSPALYEEFKEFGHKPINRFAEEIDMNLRIFYPQLDPECVLEKALIERVWKQFGVYSAVQLSNMSHSKHEPWFQIPKHRPGLAIPNDLIKKCFKSMMQGAS
jgi:uncharacterized phage-associated protein